MALPPTFLIRKCIPCFGWLLFLLILKIYFLFNFESLEITQFSQRFYGGQIMPQKRKNLRNKYKRINQPWTISQRENII